jgi:flagellar basal body P-ring formation protein FlgA
MTSLRTTFGRCAPRFHMLAMSLAVFAAAFGGAAFAGPVDLRADISISGGRLTLGDVFDGAGPAARVVVATAPPGGNAVLDAGRLQLVARANGLEWANPNGLRRVIARADGGGASTPVAGNRSVLMYARSLAAGEIVQPEDLVWGKAAAAPSDAPRDPEAVIGKAAKRALREGAAAGLRDVSAPQVIKAGDVVAVAFDSDGIRLVLQAKAMTGAGVGDAFNVQNPTSKKLIQVVAIGPGEAVVGPAADLAKSQQFASR